MSTTICSQLVERTIAFHGHICPGLTSGIRVAEIALREIGPHAEDEELVAVVETDSCGVDAIQYLVGCTFGKGNLIHLDHGQSVFTFSRRSDGKTVRISARPKERSPEPGDVEARLQRLREGTATEEELAAHAAWWKKRSLAVLEADEADLFEVETLDNYRIPERASIHESIRCDSCGLMTMSTRVTELDGRQLCIECYDRETSR